MAIDPSIMEGAQIAGAGGIGGALRAFTSKNLSMRDSVITTAFGIAFSHYFAPIFVSVIMNRPTLGSTTATGFVVGFVGMSVAQVLLNLNWREIVLRFLPSGKVNTETEL